MGTEEPDVEKPQVRSVRRIKPKGGVTVSIRRSSIMKHLCIFVIVCFIFVSISVVGEGGNNILMNPSFEEGHDGSGVPVSWRKGTLSRKDSVADAPDSKSTIVVASPGKTGEHAAVMALGENDVWIILDQVVPYKVMDKGEKYLFSVWLKADKPVPVVISLHALCPLMQKSYTMYTECKITDLWQKFDVGITIAPKIGDPTTIESLPEDAPQYLRGIVQVREVGVNIYIDDASLIRVDSGTDIKGGN